MTETDSAFCIILVFYFLPSSCPFPAPRSALSSAASSATASNAWSITERDAPNQPPASTIPKMNVNGKNLSFMGSWYQKFPWIHYCPERKAALCFYCAKAHQLGKGRSDHQEAAFTSVGMKNWKKALQKFQKHSRSQQHQELLTAGDIGCRPINLMVKSAERTAQEVARKNLRRLITTVKYLAQEGIAFRGHAASEGHFKELLRLRADDSPELREWLKKKENFTHHDIQNEMLRLISHEVVRGLVAELHSDGQPTYFSVIVDGTQDVNGLEQESICLRYVDDDLQVHEEFLGFFQCASTTGADLAAMVKDALRRLNIPMASLRGMAFDGAANMSGRERGAQAILRETQPAALFVHCGAHCTNLVARDSCDASPVVKSALACVNELGCLFSESGKLRQRYVTVCIDADVTSQKLRPLCPTRWTVRLAAVDAVLDRYDEITTTLEELAAGSSHLSARAAGLHAQLCRGVTLVALHIVRAVLAPLDRLSRELQGSSCTVSALLESVRMTVKLLREQRESAEQVVQDLLTLAEKSNCEEVALPRKKRRTSRYDGTAPSHHPGSLNEYLRAEYLMVLDTACAQLQERFNQEGVHEHGKMERLLLTAPDATTMKELIADSPWAGDLSPADLAPDLKVLFRTKKPQSLADAVKTVVGMEKAAQRMVPRAVRLLRLLLCLPASSATAERSFSALRRLKTWLRATMTQTRLNSVAVCHVHRKRVADVDTDRVAAAFVSLNSRREKVFGAIKGE